MNPDCSRWGVQNVGMVRARERAGLTLKQAAKAIGKYMTARRVSEYEFQEAQPSLKTLKRMAEAYGCAVSDLIQI